MCGMSTFILIETATLIDESILHQSCDQPFENPSFFQRDGKPFCERCFSIMIKNEL